ncbi:MAG: N-acetyl-alpha-D-glucosaminyl L-malate synthase BshA, partial [Candidatus Methylomirabilota bacterium]
LFPMTKFALEQSDGVTCVSQHLADTTRELFGLTRPLAVIPNFVDTRQFAPEPNPTLREHLAPRGEKILVHLSNFRSVKRVPDTVRIFARVRERLLARLVLIGDGQDRPEALHVARSLGVEREVIFLGKQDDVAALLAVADLFLLPSEQEAFGLAALEAQSCAVPVIATAVGGLPEVVEDGVSGFLLPVGDVEAMARAALELLGDSARYASFREAARRRTVTRFDTALIAPRYEAYYREILGRQG